MKSYQGQCQCGHTLYSIELPLALTEYDLRECDCTYCSSNGIKYLSDPAAKIIVDETFSFVIERQGSGQADFYRCAECGDLVFCAYAFSKNSNHHSTISSDTVELKGAVNGRLIKTASNEPSSIVVSPSRLSPTEKLSRWEQLWSNIAFTSEIFNTPKRPCDILEK